MNRFHSNYLATIIMCCVCCVSSAHGAHIDAPTYGGERIAVLAQEEQEREARIPRTMLAINPEFDFAQAQHNVDEWDAKLHPYDGKFNKMLKENEILQRLHDDETDGYSLAAKYLRQLIGFMADGRMPFSQEKFDAYKTLFLKAAPFIYAPLFESVVTKIVMVEANNHKDNTAAVAYCKELFLVALEKAEDVGCVYSALDHLFKLNQPNGSASVVTFAQESIDAIETAARQGDFDHGSNFTRAAQILILLMDKYHQPGAIEYGKKKFANALEDLLPTQLMSDYIMKQWVEGGSEKEIKDTLKQGDEVFDKYSKIKHREQEIARCLTTTERKELTEALNAAQRVYDVLKNLTHRENIIEYCITIGMMGVVSLIVFPVVELLYKQGKVDQAHAYIKEVHAKLVQKNYTKSAQGLKTFIDTLKSSDQQPDTTRLNFLYGPWMRDCLCERYQFVNGLEL